MPFRLPPTLGEYPDLEGQHQLLRRRSQELEGQVGDVGRGRQPHDRKSGQ